jgi:hypothetical protein
MPFVAAGHLAPEHAPAMIEEKFTGRLFSGKGDEASQAKGGVGYIARKLEIAARCR